MREQAWPQIVSADELHDALVVHGFLTAAEADFPDFVSALGQQRRLTRLSAGETLFVAADPRTGAMDFAGVNEGFRTFFGTAENPETVARSTFQVAGLVGPHYLIEIEAVAAKAPN